MTSFTIQQTQWSVSLSRDHPAAQPHANMLNEHSLTEDKTKPRKLSKREVVASLRTKTNFTFAIDPSLAPIISEIPASNQLQHNQSPMFEEVMEQPIQTSTNLKPPAGLSIDEMLHTYFGGLGEHQNNTLGERRKEVLEQCQQRFQKKETQPSSQLRSAPQNDYLNMMGVPNALHHPRLQDMQPTVYQPLIPENNIQKTSPSFLPVAQQNAGKDFLKVTIYRSSANSRERVRTEYNPMSLKKIKLDHSAKMRSLRQQYRPVLTDEISKSMHEFARRQHEEHLQRQKWEAQLRQGDTSSIGIVSQPTIIANLQPTNVTAVPQVVQRVEPQVEGWIPPNGPQPQPQKKPSQYQSQAEAMDLLSSFAQSLQSYRTSAPVQKPRAFIRPDSSSTIQAQRKFDVSLLVQELQTLPPQAQQPPRIEQQQVQCNGAIQTQQLHFNSNAPPALEQNFAAPTVMEAEASLPQIDFFEAPLQNLTQPICVPLTFDNYPLNSQQYPPNFQQFSPPNPEPIDLFNQEISEMVGWRTPNAYSLQNNFGFQCQFPVPNLAEILFMGATPTPVFSSNGARYVQQRPITQEKSNTKQSSYQKIDYCSNSDSEYQQSVGESNLVIQMCPPSNHTFPPTTIMEEPPQIKLQDATTTDSQKSLFSSRKEFVPIVRSSRCKETILTTKIDPPSEHEIGSLRDSYQGSIPEGVTLLKPRNYAHSSPNTLVKMEEGHVDCSTQTPSSKAVQLMLRSNPRGPRCTRYQCLPDIALLDHFPNEDLKQIRNLRLVSGNTTVIFRTPVNLLDVDLDKAVTIGEGTFSLNFKKLRAPKHSILVSYRNFNNFRQHLWKDSLDSYYKKLNDFLKDKSFKSFDQTTGTLRIRY